MAGRRASGLGLLQMVQLSPQPVRLFVAGQKLRVRAGVEQGYRPLGGYEPQARTPGEEAALSVRNDGLIPARPSHDIQPVPGQAAAVLRRGGRIEDEVLGHLGPLVDSDFLHMVRALVLRLVRDHLYDENRTGPLLRTPIEYGTAILTVSSRELQSRGTFTLLQRPLRDLVSTRSRLLAWPSTQFVSESGKRGDIDSAQLGI
jgi:hypothetical protein